MDGDHGVVSSHDDSDLHGINRLLGDGTTIEQDTDLGMLTQLTQIDTKTIEDVFQGVLNEREVNNHSGKRKFV